MHGFLRVQDSHCSVPSHMADEKVAMETGELEVSPKGPNER